MMYNLLPILPFLLLIHHKSFAAGIDFSQVPAWLDSPSCGYTTNKCLCSGSTILEMVLDATAKCAEQCQCLLYDTNGKKLTDYSVSKGYNSVGSPTVLISTPTGTPTGIPTDCDCDGPDRFLF
ncbi:hypothetical protein BGX38DRAFT_1196614 [Terfezia claveryi]|nr:hypothetical protein BGX38DRAFT_1196614 [Terfezia claveryi]